MSSTPKNPLNMTLGIELEFVCVYPDHAFDSLAQAPQDGAFGDVFGYFDAKHLRAGPALFLLLQKRGIPVTGWEALDAAEVEEFSTWTLKEDASLSVSKAERELVPGNWNAEDIEINSRKITLSDTQSDWQGELRAIIDTIFKLEDWGCRVLTNATTGLHVHVGNNRDFIPLEAAKKVFQLGTVFAPVRCCPALLFHPIRDSG